MALALNNCCFCITLRTGSLIIGYLNLIGTLIMTPLLIYLIVDKANNSDEKIEMISVSLATIFFIINLIFNIALLVGLHKCKRGPINAYLMYSILFVIVVVIINALMVGSPPSAWMVIQIFLYFVLSIYFLVVIWSYSLKMDDVTRRPVIYNAA